MSKRGIYIALIIELSIIGVLSASEPIDLEAFNTRPRPFSTSSFNNLISLYETYISRNDCQFFPSCSRFCYIQVQQKGVLGGLPLCWERLYRCNESSHLHYPRYNGFLLDLPDGFSIPMESLGIAPAYSYSGNGGYCRWLVGEGELELAYGCILRHNYEKGDSADALLLGAIALNIGKYSRAVDWLEKSNEPEAAVISGLAYYRLQRPNKALSVIRGENEPLRDEFSPFGDGVELASMIKTGSRDTTSIRMKLQSLGMDDYYSRCIDAFSPPGKIPSAIASAALPGSGQILNGFYRDGLGAFVFCALTGLFLFTNIDDNNEAGIALGGILFASAYTGNVIGGYKSPVIRKNRKRGELIEKIELESGIDEPIDIEHLFERNQE